MALRDYYFPLVFCVRCIVAVRNFISLVYVVPKIWLVLMGTLVLQEKNHHMSTNRQKTQTDESESERFAQFVFDICTRQR